VTRTAVPVACAIVAIAWLASRACADGGVVAASVERDERRITVFVSPAAPRAGVIDVSMLRRVTTDTAVDARLDLDRSAIIVVAVHEASGMERSAPALPAHQGNRLLESALLELPFSGRWRIEVRNEPPWPSPSFELEIAPPLPPWRSQWPWLGAWIPITALLLLRDRLAFGRSR